MLATPVRRGISILAVSILFTISTGSGQIDESSALEKDPKGWIDMLASAGTQLEGWTRGPIPPGGKLQEQSQWSLDPTNGHLICQGDRGHEWLRLDQVLTDFVLHVEWRFTPVPGKKGYNSGIYVRNSSDARMWHQAQCGDASGGYLFGESMFMYSVKPFNLRKEARQQKVKPAGEWNTYEITCKSRKVNLWVNGAVTNTWDGCEAPRGYVGLEAEGWRIEFRNIKVKLL
jgi:hypothetical protein